MEPDYSTLSNAALATEIRKVAAAAQINAAKLEALKRHRSLGWLAIAGGFGLLTASGPAGLIFGILGVLGFLDHLRIEARVYADEQRLLRELAHLSAALEALKAEATSRGVSF